MKLLTLLALLTLMGCASAPESKPMKPHSTDRSDAAHQELDKEMGK